MRRVVVFDLDDTLFPEWQYVLSGFRAVDEWLQKNLERTGFYEKAKAQFDVGARGNIFDIVLKELGEDSQLVGKLVEVYRQHRPTLSLYDDARWAIDHFQRCGPLGLISDGYLVAQQNKFDALKIREHFQAVVFSDCYGRECWKPSPVPYQKIMELIPGVAGDYVYVADNPKKDFIAPRQLGWGTIQIDRPEGVYHGVEVAPELRAEVVITSLIELENM